MSFGRIIGMKTRMGGVTFLEDVLDEARENMMRKLKEAESKENENCQKVNWTSLFFTCSKFSKSKL